MLSILDIILISLGGLVVITYTTLKILQLIKYKKYIKLGIQNGLTEQEARKNANQAVYIKNTTKERAPNVNDDDDIWEN